MRILKAGALYFALVFAAGFVLGTVRTIWIIPRFDTRMAELMETPLMLVVTLFAARWVVNRFVIPPAFSQPLMVGLIGLGLLLLAEFSVVLWLRRLTIPEYLASRDPVAGTVYLVMLGVFAIMPLLLARR